MSKTQGIAVQGQIMKIATTIDGGWRVTFDVPMDYGAQILQISALMQEGVSLVVIPFLPEEGVKYDG